MSISIFYHDVTCGTKVNMKAKQLKNLFYFSSFQHHTVTRMDREAKRQREKDPQLEDFLMLGLNLQNKANRQEGSLASAERNFQEFFGTSSLVVAVL